MSGAPPEQHASSHPRTHQRKYGAFQTEIYGKGMIHGVKPSMTTDPNKLEAQAKEHMTSSAYSYVAGGAGERATMDANRLAFRSWKLVPRMLRPTTTRDLTVKLFGETYDCPVLCAPVGVQNIFHPDGEKGVAEMAASIGVTYVASTASSHTMEQIAEANGPEGQRWFQLYWPQHKPVTESLLKRAKSLNYKVLVVTLDTWALAWRPWDLDNAYVPFFVGIGNATGFSDPAFRARVKEETGKEVEDDIESASKIWIGDVFSGKAHSWEELAHLRQHWDGPILLKGIQDPEDALKAVEHKMDGVIVSNHGGRQCDGAVGSLDMLPEVVEAVRGKTGGIGEEFQVLFDSGIRTGVDVIKALCLGAKMVLVGRPWVYGLGINGKLGARDALSALLADFDQSMGLSGMQSIADCTPKMLRRIQYPGDVHSNN